MRAPTIAERLAGLEVATDELLEAHRGRSLDDFGEYADDPVRFMRDVLHFHPWEKQQEVAAAVLAGKRTVVRGCHGGGKDACLAALALWAAYSRRMLVIAISATERQLTGQLWSELARLWSRRAQLGGELYTGDLRIAGERRVIAMTSGSVSNLTGWHNHLGTGVLVAISESQAEQVGNAAFDAAEGNAAGEGSRICVVGNPIAPAGRFYDVHSRPSWSKIRISALEHPNVVEGHVVIPGGPSPTWPAEMAAEFGEDSPWYISRVLAEFPLEGTVDSLMRGEWIDDAFARHTSAIAAGPLPTVAIDVARSIDRDESVAAVAQGAHVRSLHAWRSRDLVRTAERFLSVADRARLEWYAMQKRTTIDLTSRTLDDPAALRTWLARFGVPACSLIVDTPGVGSGVVDECRRQGREVEEYWGWKPPRDEKRFANVRAEVYWSLRERLRIGDGSLPRDGLLREELLAIQWSEDSRGRIIILPKDELRKALRRSPDRADAVTIALAGRSGVRRGSVGFGTIKVSI